eukprot:tig00000821_g4515.t1
MALRVSLRAAPAVLAGEAPPSPNELAAQTSRTARSAANAASEPRSSIDLSALIRSLNRPPSAARTVTPELLSPGTTVALLRTSSAEDAAPAAELPGRCTAPEPKKGSVSAAPGASGGAAPERAEAAGSPSKENGRAEAAPAPPQPSSSPQVSEKRRVRSRTLSQNRSNRRLSVSFRAGESAPEAERERERERERGGSPVERPASNPTTPRSATSRPSTHRSEALATRRPPPALSSAAAPPDFAATVEFVLKDDARRELDWQGITSALTLTFADDRLERNFARVYAANAVPRAVLAGVVGTLAALVSAAVSMAGPSQLHLESLFFFLGAGVALCGSVLARTTLYYRRRVVLHRLGAPLLALLFVCTLAAARVAGRDELSPASFPAALVLVVAIVRVPAAWATPLTLAYPLLLFLFGLAYLPAATAAALSLPTALVWLVLALNGRSAEMTARRNFWMGRLREQTHEAASREKAKGARILRNILPEPVIEAVREGRPLEGNVNRRYDAASVVFVAHCAPPKLTDGDIKLVMRRANALVGRLEELCDEFGCEKIKTIGLTFMAVCGLPRERPDHAARAVAFAAAAVAEGGRLDFSLHAGVSSGSVVAGVVGCRLFYDTWGDTVNTASRMCSYAAPGTVLCSSATRVLLPETPLPDPRLRFSVSSGRDLLVKGKGVQRTYETPSTRPAPPEPPPPAPAAPPRRPRPRIPLPAPPSVAAASSLLPRRRGHAGAAGSAAAGAAAGLAGTGRSQSERRRRPAANYIPRPPTRRGLGRPAAAAAGEASASAPDVPGRPLAGRRPPVRRVASFTELARREEGPGESSGADDGAGPAGESPLPLDISGVLRSASLRRRSSSVVPMSPPPEPPSNAQRSPGQWNRLKLPPLRSRRSSVVSTQSESGGPPIVPLSNAPPSPVSGAASSASPAPASAFAGVASGVAGAASGLHSLADGMTASRRFLAYRRSSLSFSSAGGASGAGEGAGGLLEGASPSSGIPSASALPSANNSLRGGRAYIPSLSIRPSTPPVLISPPGGLPPVPASPHLPEPEEASPGAAAGGGGGGFAASGRLQEPRRSASRSPSPSPRRGASPSPRRTSRSASPAPASDRSEHSNATTPSPAPTPPSTGRRRGGPTGGPAEASSTLVPSPAASTPGDEASKAASASGSGRLSGGGGRRDRDRERERRGSLLAGGYSFRAFTLQSIPSQVRLTFADPSLETEFWSRRRSASLPDLRASLLLGAVAAYTACWPALERAAGAPGPVYRLVFRYLCQGVPLLLLALGALLAPRPFLRLARPALHAAFLAILARLAVQLLLLEPYRIPGTFEVGFGSGWAIRALGPADAHLFLVIIHTLPGPCVPWMDLVPYSGAAAAVVGASGSGVAQALYVAVVAAVCAVACWFNELKARREYETDRGLYEETAGLGRECAETRRLLHLCLPASIAEGVREGLDLGAAMYAVYDRVVVLCADVVGFTPLSESLGADELVRLLDELVTRLDVLAEERGVARLKTIGDAWLAALGLDEPPGPGAVADLVELAAEVAETGAAFSRECGHRLALRVGVAAGSACGAVVGNARWFWDLFGEAMDRAGEMEAGSEAGRVLVCPRVHADCVQAGRLAFEPVFGPRAGPAGPQKPLSAASLSETDGESGAPAGPPTAFFLARTPVSGRPHTPSSHVSLLPLAFATPPSFSPPQALSPPRSRAG